MPTYLITHHFPDGFQPGPETAAAARAWFDGLGEHLISGQPASLETQRLGRGRGDPQQVAYSLVAADDLAAAAALASGWPLLARGGGVDVRELALRRVPVGTGV